MIQRLLVVVLTGLVTLGLYSILSERSPDPGLIDLAVRSTVFALPTPSPRVVEILVETTRLVEVTRVVEVTRIVEVVMATTPEAPPAPPPATPIPSPSLRPAREASAPLDSLSQTTSHAPERSTTDQSSACSVTANRDFVLIPVLGPPTSHPDAEHGDLNLALRGYVETSGPRTLIDINGPTDGDAPQLAGVLEDRRQPAIAALYRVGDWDWACGVRGCRGGDLAHIEASAFALATQPGASIHIPRRGPEIYGGGYVALVLYAEPTRLTVVYTREDSVANGYAVHLEGFCVDPALLERYRTANAAGRSTLPALRNGEPVGSAAAGQVVVAVRDRGTFKDPRSRKDWWQGY